MKETEEIRETLIKALEEHEKNLELQRLRDQTKETQWKIMKRGLIENTIPLTIDWTIFIVLMYLLGII